MIFTRHAFERYRQFHMLDNPTATDEDARVALEAHASEAVKLPAKTRRGHEVWTIHALGVEMVIKRDGDFENPVCVTVLPPGRFRGLTPLQAGSVEESAKRAAERAAAAQQELAEAKKKDAEIAKLAARVAQAKKVKDKPGTGAKQQAEAHAEAARRKEAVAQAQRDHQERIILAKRDTAMATAERDILLESLKAMRAQLVIEQRDRIATVFKRALRIALRHLKAIGDANALDAIAAVDPGLVLDKFIGGGDAP